jgi:hypothetical protein
VEGGAHIDHELKYRIELEEDMLEQEQGQQTELKERG